MAVMTIKHLLITGGCGFIGTTLILKLLQINPDIHIRVLDNFIAGTPKDLAEVTAFTKVSATAHACRKGVVLIQGDIRDKEVVLACAEGVDCIVHLAANTGVPQSVENPVLDMECNVIGTVNMLEAARLKGVKKFIFASSGAPTGEVEPPIHEELPPHPISPYGASKLAGEGYCSAYYRTFEVDTVCLRFGNVYGPRSTKKSSVVAKFLRQALAGKSCVIYGDGAQTRDFLYVDDLVKAIFLSIDKDVGGETFQIATGIERTVCEVAGILSTALAKRGVRMKISYDVPRLGDVKRNFADTSKARRILGWMPTMDLDHGIEKTIDYFMKTIGIN
jgi:UDP-glucose 4-epimerase